MTVLSLPERRQISVSAGWQSITDTRKHFVEHCHQITPSLSRYSSCEWYVAQNVYVCQKLQRQCVAAQCTTEGLMRFVRICSCCL